MERQNHNKNKRKAKQYFKSKQQESKKSAELQEGISGFLVTCDNLSKERRCIGECYNLLSIAVENIYGKQWNESAFLSEFINQGKEQIVSEQKDELEREIEILKQRDCKMWYTFETDTKGIIFIKMLPCFKSIIDVSDLARYIYEQVQIPDSQLSSRFVSRFVPISFMAKASGNENEFKRHFSPTINKLIDDKVNKKIQDTILNKESKSILIALSFCVEFKNKTNKKVVRNNVIQWIKDIFIKEKEDLIKKYEEKGLENYPDEEYEKDWKIQINIWNEFRDADLDIIVEVYRDLQMVGIVEGYKETKRKCNLKMLQIGMKKVQEINESSEEEQQFHQQNENSQSSDEEEVKLI